HFRAPHSSRLPRHLARADRALLPTAVPPEPVVDRGDRTVPFGHVSSFPGAVAADGVAAVRFGLSGATNVAAGFSLRLHACRRLKPAATTRELSCHFWELAAIRSRAFQSVLS